MSTLDEIVAGANTVMTPSLRRLFLAAGCDPACHACAKKIKDGAVFKLVTHVRAGKSSDEMCCGRCGPAELKKRDVQNARAHRAHAVSNSVGNGVGYSRPTASPATPAPTGEA